MLTGSSDDVVTSTRGFELVPTAGIAKTNSWLCFLLISSHLPAKGKLDLKIELYIDIIHT